MGCDCKITHTATDQGHTLVAEITGDIVWKNTSEYPGLPIGDPDGPPSDTNPSAVFLDGIGKVCATMSVLGFTDADPDPHVAVFTGLDQTDACAFQTVILQVAVALSEVGQRHAAKKNPHKHYDHARIIAAWKLAGNAGKKPKKN